MFIPWLSNRKNTFIGIIIDLTILLLIFINEKTYLNNFNELLISALIPWILISYIYGRYSFENKLKFSSLIIHLIFSNSVSIAITIVCMKLVNIIFDLFLPNYFISISDLEIIFKLSFCSIIMQSIFYYFTHFINKKKHSILIIGDVDMNKFRFLPDEKRYYQNIKLSYFSGNNFLKENLDFNEILITNDKLNKKELDFCREMSLRGIKIFSSIKWIEKYFNRTPSELLTTYQFFKSNYIPLYDFQLRLKRLADISISIVLLTFLLPINIFLIFLIKLEDGGPIFYSQKRNGFKNKPFKIWKFRSMIIESEADGPQWAEREDKRITKVGSFIRKLRLDETPQLVNVIVGDMSLIGPRPERPEIDSHLSKEINLYNLRYSIRPGLSGWAQVNYPYGASIEDAQNKLSYDLFYMKNFSFFLDFLILLKTLRLVLNLEGSIPKNDNN